MSLDKQNDTSRTFVITGGTDGLGRALATHYLGHGDRVVVIGSNTGKGRRFLDEANELGAGDRAEFIPADLSLVAENQRVIAEISRKHPVVDALVLAARYYRSQRHETAEGVESNFALFYLSRFLFSHGLAGQLAQAHRPVILDLSGPGHPLSNLNLDDLEFARGYRPDKVMAQCGKLSDLLGVEFAARHPDSGIRYVLAHPGLTRTGFTGQYDEADAAIVAAMRERAQPIPAAVARLRRHLDEPAGEPLSAFMQDTKVEVTGEPFDAATATRLWEHTTAMLTRITHPQRARSL